MSTENFNIATAKKAELKQYAKEHLELTLPMTMGEDTMRSKIMEFCAANGIEPPQSEIAVKRKGKRTYELITINIAKQSKPGGSDPVFVGFNGVGYSIPRGLNIKVPAPLVEILTNANQDIVTQDEDGIIHHEDVLTYPFQKVG